MIRIWILALALCLPLGLALAQTLYPNQLAPRGLSGGGGTLGTLPNVDDDANLVVLTNDAGTRLQAQ